MRTTPCALIKDLKVHSRKAASVTNNKHNNIQREAIVNLFPQISTCDALANSLPSLLLQPFFHQHVHDRNTTRCRARGPPRLFVIVSLFINFNTPSTECPDFAHSLLLVTRRVFAHLLVESYCATGNQQDVRRERSSDRGAEDQECQVSEGQRSS